MEHTDNKEKSSSWLLPKRVNAQKLRAGLYLLATPIGNLGDMTVRGLDTLAAADIVLCEDTRVTGKLLRAFALSRPMKIYNDHSDEADRSRVLGWISEGKAVVLASDAGTPLISDPGYKLVEAVRAAGHMVTSLPGANAPLTALQLSGMPSDRFSFIGFLPVKSGARQALFQEWAAVDTTLIAFETAPRLVKALTDIAAVYGERRGVSVTRELTKLYEEVVSGTPQELIARYEEKGLPKGEIVLVIGPPDNDFDDDAFDMDGRLRILLREMSVKDVVGVLVEQTGKPKKEIYAMALSIKEDME
jgi:16S rRNA (cytidine1402-2'-O)-methyltransferase